jgi:hypothetical protein
MERISSLHLLCVSGEQELFQSLTLLSAFEGSRVEDKFFKSNIQLPVAFLISEIIADITPE